jgi:LPS O-antigen subunit length determinant protein (WzzB/FepE family)
MEEFLQRKIDKLEQKIATNEERLLNEADPLRRQSLKEFIDRDTAALKGLYDKIATSQPAQSKFEIFSPLLSYFVQQLLL